MGGNSDNLVDLPVREFLDRLASATPQPGGGSCAALVGALAASLGQMAVAFTTGREKFAQVESEVQGVGQRLAQANQMLRRSIQEDSDAYAALSKSFKMDKADPKRAAAIESTASIAAGVPFQTAVLAKRVHAELERLKPIANPNLRSDVEAAIFMARAAREAAIANTRINLPYMNEAAAKRIEDELAGLV
ncbi:MAG: cyclodeaminase/cyclohydrolase family protein [Phycisphaerae bacterium]